MIIRPDREFETLYDFLDHYKDDIEYVMLTWTWPNMYVIESKNALMVWDYKHREYYPKELDLGFSVSEIDEEYTFWGPIEDALEFAKSYDCWDGVLEYTTLSIDDGMLEFDHEGDNFDSHYHPHEFDPNGNYLAVVSLGYVACTDGDNWHTVTHGPVVKMHYVKNDKGFCCIPVIDAILDEEPGLTTWESPLCKRCTKYEKCRKMDPLETPPIKMMDAGEGRYLYDPVCPERDLIDKR